MSISIAGEKPAHQKNLKEYKLKAETIIEALENRSKIPADFLIFMDSKNRESRVSADDILKNAESVAQFLLSKGLNKDDKIVIMLPTGADFVYVYFGTLMAGGIPVPVTQPAGTGNIEKYLDNLKHIISNSDAKFFITYDGIKKIIASLMNISHFGCEFIFNSEIFQNSVPENEYKMLPKIDSSDVALIQYTSGTTGKPKGVVLTHNNLLHNVHAICVGINITADDVGISWLPLYHDMGLIGGLFVAMYSGNSMVIMMPEIFLLKPQWWLENISKYNATVSVAPNFGYHYCVTRIRNDTLKNLDLSSWRIALNGAEPIDRITLTRFMEKFKPYGLKDDILFPVYGMAEDSLAATFPALDNKTVVRRFLRKDLEEDSLAIDTDSNDSKIYIDLVSVGYPLIGQEIKIVDSNGDTLKERQVGEIAIMSPSLTGGYYKNNEATEEAIRDRCFYTGDMGFILDGLLYISGRSKEMIIKRGKNFYPYDIERIASMVKGVRLGCTAAFAIPNESTGTEDLVLICETLIKGKTRLDTILKEINNELVSRLGISADVIRLVPRGAIPKTSSGKTQRVQIKKNYLENKLIPSKRRNYLILIQTVMLSYFKLFWVKTGWSK